MDTTIYTQIQKELSEGILPFWEKYARNPETEGFYGEIDNAGNPDKEKSRTSVMVARYLWSYSAAARYFGKVSYLDFADAAYQDLAHHFFDTLNGGFYWSVTASGDVEKDDKVLIAQAYVLYAVCEYAAALREVRKLDYPATVVMDKALALYSLAERYARSSSGGYIEACTAAWKTYKTYKISEWDTECALSLNTNMHMMLAFTNLHKTLPAVYEDQKDLRELVGKTLKNLAELVSEKILMNNGHVGMCFDADWNRIGGEISYGHDIEMSWLLWDAANEIENDDLLAKIRPQCVTLAHTVFEQAFDKNLGSLKGSPEKSKWGDFRSWWCQAESLVGFYNAWEISGVEDYKLVFQKQWEWIMKYQRDSVNGDWFASVYADGKPVEEASKGNIWKCSFHNVRCCLEILKRAGIKSEKN